MDYIIMNIKEIVQTPYTTSPRFTPIDSVKFKDYLQEAFEERLNEYNTLLGDMKQMVKIAVKFMTFNLLVKQFTIAPYLLKIIHGILLNVQLN